MTARLTLAEFHARHVLPVLPPEMERHISDEAVSAHELASLLREKSRHNPARMFELASDAGPADAAAALLSQIHHFSTSVEKEIVRSGAAYLASLA